MNTGRSSFVAGMIEKAININLGWTSFVTLQAASELHNQISKSYSQLGAKYNALSNQQGLWMIQNHTTKVNATLVSHSTVIDFYLPNGSVFHTITY